jgi:hypothetical protein
VVFASRRYESLPLTTRSLIEESIGPVLAVEPVKSGMNYALAARVRTVDGEFFVKGLPTDPHRVWTQQREADLAAHVASVAPALVTHVVARGWDVLVFTAVKARHADYRPGSPDVATTASLLRRLATIAAPPIELRRAEQRLAAYVDRPQDAGLFAGDALLHTDWNNANVLIGERTWLVDWGWATRGAPWLDAAYWIIWLIAAGHEPAGAESHAAQISAFSTAPVDAVTAFAQANARVWHEVAGTRDDVWTSRLRGASAAWARYRRHGG